MQRGPLMSDVDDNPNIGLLATNIIIQIIKMLYMPLKFEVIL